VGIGKAMALKFATAGPGVAIVVRRCEPLAEAVREIGVWQTLPSLSR
jgi:NAD(P)-dependent dehydrogenase (short-subunit alcohol dehydrogenase family)